MKLLIGADIVPTKSNQESFINCKIEKLVDNELKKVLDTAEYRIFNLEVPLTDFETPISKCGPNLIAPTATVNGIKAIGADFLTLANNHILDQGEQGLQSTVDVLSKAGISYAGAGSTPEEAAKPYIIEKDGKRIAIYCCAEHEFSIVTNHSAGANPFDPLESLDHIVALKNECDYMIVLYHGGKECYRYPSPNMQKVCRKIVDKGADLVICQHTHCIGCGEKWNGGTIVYGQGNFLFDHSDSEYWQTSLLVEIDMDDSIKLDYIPLCKSGSGVRLAEVKEKQDILEHFHTRSKEITEPGFIDAKFSEFCETLGPSMLLQIHGVDTGKIAFRGLNKLLGYKLAPWLASKKNKMETRLLLQNFIECEAWREVFIRKLVYKTFKNRQ